MSSATVWASQCTVYECAVMVGREGGCTGVASEGGFKGGLRDVTY
jgi:hypothetical protein